MMEDSEQILESELGEPVQFDSEEYSIIDTQSGKSIQAPYQIVQGLDGQLFVITGLEAHLVPGEEETEAVEIHHNHDHEMEDEDLNVEFHNEIQAVVEIPNEMDTETEGEGMDGDGEGEDPLNTGGVETYDATIESVVRAAAKTVTDDEVEAAFRARVNRRRILGLQKRTCTESHVSQKSIPFQYSGQSFDVQSQKLILNVLHFLKDYTSSSKGILQSTKTPQEKAARVLNISSSVIGKIKKNLQIGMLKQPGKIRKASKRILDSVKPEDEEVIRLIYREMVEKNESPSIPPILFEARKRINYNGSRTSFRRILYRMGFTFMRVGDRVVMIDTTDPTRSAPPSATKLKGPGQGRKKRNWRKKRTSISETPETQATEEPSESEFQHLTPNDEEGVIDTRDPSNEISEASTSESLSETHHPPPPLVFQIEGREYCIQVMQDQKDTI